MYLALELFHTSNLDFVHLGVFSERGHNLAALGVIRGDDTNMLWF
jgi:hypothetical protein